MKQISIRLDDEIVQELDKLAKKTGRSKTFYVKQAILEQLEDIKDYYDVSKALKEFKKSGEKAVPYSQIRQELLS